MKAYFYGGKPAELEDAIQNNEECALAMFENLKKNGKIAGTEDERIDILHDINNLRGREWLELLPLNAETAPVFVYLSPKPVIFHGDGAVLEDTFICDDSITPDFYWFLATGEKGVDIFDLNELRDKMDEAKLGDVWDFCMEDIDEAIENNEHLVIVEPYAPSKEECRIFEVTADMLGRYQAYMAEKVLEQTDFTGDRPKMFEIFNASHNAETLCHPGLNQQISEATRVLDYKSVKEYELTLFEGEEDEQVVRAMLTDEQVAMIRKDMAGILNSEYTVTLEDGSLLEAGCIDDILLIENEPVTSKHDTELKNEER